MYEESSNSVDWGAIANFTTRLGTFTEIGWKNLYTRNADDEVIQNSGSSTLTWSRQNHPARIPGQSF